MGIHGQMYFRPDLLDGLSAFGGGPRAWDASLGRMSISVKLNRQEVLEQANKHKRHLIVCELPAVSAEDTVEFVKKTDLLSKADPRAGVERNEYERIVGEVLLCAVVEEAVWIKFKSCWPNIFSRTISMVFQSHTIWAPQIRPTLHHKYAVNGAGYLISDFLKRSSVHIISTSYSLGCT